MHCLERARVSPPLYVSDLHNHLKNASSCGNLANSSLNNLETAHTQTVEPAGIVSARWTCCLQFQTDVFTQFKFTSSNCVFAFSSMFFIIFGTYSTFIFAFAKFPPQLMILLLRCHRRISRFSSLSAYNNYFLDPIPLITNFVFLVFFSCSFAEVFR